MAVTASGIGPIRLAPHLISEWHSVRNGELRPDDVPPRSRRVVWWRCRRGHEWQARVQNRTAGTGCPYCAGRRVTPDRSLSVLHPSLARQWHPALNGGMTPVQVGVGSTRRVWWRCEAGHDWQASVATRTSKRSRCPYCIGRRPTRNTSLATRRPDLAAEWHRTLNGDLTPDDVVPGANRRVWWQCPAGHQWATTVAARSAKGGTGCPRCADHRRRGVPLGVVAPHLLPEWVVELNAGEGAGVPAGSNRQVWWRCGLGHLWRARVQQRSRYGHGCPYCSGRLAGPQRNLAAHRPDLALQWHPTFNGELSPTDVAPYSGRQVWWLCTTGHAWCCKIVERSRRSTGCPACARQAGQAGHDGGVSHLGDG